MQTIAALRSDPAFPYAQQACLFFRGSPTEDKGYQARIREGHRGVFERP